MRDSGDFDAFYHGTARRVLQYIYLVCGDLTEAQDVVQEAYARAWQRWSTVSTYDDPEAWVRTVAWRLSANWWRSVRRRLALLPRISGPQSTPGPTEDRVELIAVLRQLPEAQRRVIVLHYLYDLPVAQIASRTGMPPGTVKVYLARGRAALARLLGDDETGGKTGGENN